MEFIDTNNYVSPYTACSLIKIIKIVVVLMMMVIIVLIAISISMHEFCIGIASECICTNAVCLCASV